MKVLVPPPGGACHIFQTFPRPYGLGSIILPFRGLCSLSQLQCRSCSLSKPYYVDIAASWFIKPRSALCFFRWLGQIAKWLLIDGPLFASGFPGEFAVHVRIETLQHGEAVWIVVVKPAGIVEPIPIVAGMHGAELHVKVPDDVRVSFAGFKCFAGLYAIANGIDHAVAKIGGLIENDDLRVLIVIVESGGI